MHAHLHFAEKQKIVLDRPISIGRDSANDLRLNDPKVARRHALLYRHSDNYWLTDLSSRTGTHVNGRKVGHSVALKHEDVIRIGAAQLEFRESAAALARLLSVAALAEPAAAPECLRILVLEDSAIDTELIDRELRQGGLYFTLRRVETESGFRSALAALQPQVVLMDYHVPGFRGDEALAVARALLPEHPIIFVAGTIGEELAVELVKAGATDYVLKDRLERLPSVVRRALDEVARRGLRQRSLGAHSGDGGLVRGGYVAGDPAAVVLDAGGRMVQCSRVATGLLTRYFRGRLTDRLSDPVASWLRGKPGAANPLVISAEGRRLVIRVCSDETMQPILILQEEETTFSPGRLIQFGLTPREADVMCWLSEGKTNADIATLLEVSTGTVNKHVGSILQKFGVENRQQALLAAIERFGLPQRG
jgi:DNA-binding NarL/FixJ family response regulator